MYTSMLSLSTSTSTGGTFDIFPAVFSSTECPGLARNLRLTRVSIVQLLIPRAIVAPMQAEKLFAIFEAFFNHASTPGAALVDKVHATYTFEIFPEKVGSGESKKWTIDLNTQPGKCTPQEGGGDCTFQLSAKDFLQLAANKLNPQMAFMTGKLKIKGDLGKAMKFTPDLLPKVDMKAALDASKSPKEIVALVLGGQKQSRL